ncbi:hypothetical protein HT665_09595, partial [Ursidibacter maritimus]|uniref:hypothetical protein n=1 Tax=Ursidibacter maritimus TaxID=1331689 RepID=UPI001C449091
MFNRWKIKKIKKNLRGLQANRVNNQPPEEEIKKEIIFYMELAEIYLGFIGRKKFPYAQIMHDEALRLAADLDDPEANFRLGKILLNRAKFRDSIQK